MSGRTWWSPADSAAETVTHAFLSGGVVIHLDKRMPEEDCELCQTGSESWDAGGGWTGTLTAGQP